MRHPERDGTVSATDFTIEADELRRYEYSFHLSPALWDQYKGPDDLEWTCVPFRRHYLKGIPTAPGVYAFCIRPSVGGNLCGSYLLYVGKTVRPLRTRCREYLTKADAGKERPRVLRMMRLFYGTDYLRFCFAVVPEGNDPASIEHSLLGATVPPACTDLPASVRAARNAF